VEKEQVVVEPPTTSADAATPVAPGEADFHEGEVAVVEVYDKRTDVEVTFVREQGSR